MLTNTGSSCAQPSTHALRDVATVPLPTILLPTILLSANLVFTILIGACSNSPTEPVQPSTQDAPMLSRLIVSLVPGASETVVIHTRDGATGIGPWTISISNPTIASATLIDTTIRIIAKNLGTTDITVTGGGGVRHLPVSVYSPFVLETKDLLITYVDRYTQCWNDLGSHGTYEGSFFHPVTTDGFHALGSLGLGPNGYPNPTGTHAVMVVKARPGHESALAYPTDYQQIYNDANSGADMFGSFWRPIPPAGYVAMGTVVARNTWNKPSITDVVCVRSDLTMPGEIGAFIYDDRGTGAYGFLSCWKIDQPVAGPHEPAYLVTGTFVAVNTWDRPSASPMMHVLKVELPTLAEAPAELYVPKLTGYGSPANVTCPTLEKAMLVPCSIIIDQLHPDMNWKVANSPMYRIERSVFHRLRYHNHNQTSQLQTNSYSYASGVTHGQSQSMWSETAISLSIEGGVSIKLFDAKITATISRSLGYATETSLSEFEEHTTASSINTPPGKAAALWQKYTRYILYRHVGTQLEPVSSWEFGIDSFVTDEFPD